MTVTDRGKEIAVITPLARSGGEEYLRRLVKEGKATWSGGKPRGAPRRVRAGGKPVSQIVLEDRGQPLP